MTTTATTAITATTTVTSSFPLPQPASAAPSGLPLAAAPSIDLVVMRTHAGEVVNVLKLLGNTDRLLLLCQLALQERTVTDLEQLTHIHQPSLSQQLAILRREAVVTTRREGKFIWYQLSDPRIVRLMEQLQVLYCPEELQAAATATATATAATVQQSAAGA